ATPDLARAGRALAARPGARAGAKAEGALLRYVSRAAGKVSPFSTLTPVGVGAVRDDAPSALRLRGERWRARSLVRVKPYLLDQVAAMLRLWPPFRARLRVALNGSLAETEPGRFLFVRPAHWAYDAEAGKVGWHDEAMVALGLRGPLFERMVAALAAGSPTHAELVAALEAAPGGASARAHVDELARIGVLSLLLPWSSHAPHLEKELLRALRELPDGERPEALVEALAALVAGEDGYADAADPPAALEALERAVEGLWEAAAPLGGLPEGTPRGKPTPRNVYEDVWIEPRGGEGPELLHLPRGAAEAALRSAAPLARMSALFDRRADLLDTLAAFAAERWPERAEVGVPELFRAFGPLWGDYLRFRAEARRAGDWRATWNPLSLSPVDARARARVAVWEALPECVRVEGDAQHLSVEALEALLDRHGAPPFEEAGGACLFLQPASADGRLWMMNRLKEGTGRFGSRYTPAMDPAARERYTRALAARGTLRIGGEAADLLDLADVQGDTLNVHALQTPAALERPGEAPAASPARRVRLADLRVAFGGGRACLRGADGRRYVAVHLGVAYDDYMPPLNRFLSVFGPSESAGVFPPASSEARDGVVFTRRTVLGSLVIHRRSWTFDAPALAARLAGLSEAAGFAALSRWRAEHGVPERVFLAERVPHPIQGERVQPQYLDLTSPLFAALFRGVVERERERGSVRLVEALPDAGHLPRDGAGRRWAVEALLDSLALREPRRAVAVPARAVERRVALAT
ncbi:MAG TPA: lantibiotic dehydratase, partial [Longimicrobium sp.]|nr:lantibiotic dehydratase [Longimicrobium sp.]